MASAPSGRRGGARALLLVLAVLARCRSPLDPTSTTKTYRPRLFPSLCCKCMFQVFQSYTAIVTYGCCKNRSGCCTCCIFCKCFRGMLQAFVQNILSVLDIYCSKCFIWMLHMFHTHVASVLSGCCICFEHMLQLCVSNVSPLSDVSCTEVFHVASVSRGHYE